VVDRCIVGGSETTLKRLTSNDRKKKSLMSDSLQSLIGSLGKKKADKMKRALARLTSVDQADQTVVAGNFAVVNCRLKVQLKKHV